MHRKTAQDVEQECACKPEMIYPIMHGTGYWAMAFSETKRGHSRAGQNAVFL